MDDPSVIVAFAALAVAALVGLASFAQFRKNGNGNGASVKTQIDFVRAAQKNGDGIKNVHKSVDSQHETLRDLRDAAISTNAKLDTLIELTRRNGGT